MPCILSMPSWGSRWIICTGVTEMIGGILKIVEEYYGRHFDTDSMDYERFITHLKFFRTKAV